MTRDKAIAMLKRMQEPEPFEPQINEAAFEALQMAIETLSNDKQTVKLQDSNDTISRAAAIDVASGYCHPANIAQELAKLPPAQPEYTEHEESILTMLFGIAKLIIDLQGGYMGMTDGRFFDDNDLFRLAEKMGINY